MTAAADDTLDRLFGALADPTRRAILARIAGREATVNQLVDAFDLTQPTISKHLKVLEAAGLITRGREAQFRPVRLEPKGLAGVDAWLGDYRRFWEESYERLDDYLKHLKDKDAEDER
jgi:DNA-binding transcriptional ArsR family regulator